MKLGEVLIADDDDFRSFKEECLSDIGWTVVQDKPYCKVLTKKNLQSQFDVIKVRSEFTGITGELLYDVIHDGQFRSQWDTAMLEGYEICSVSPNSDIGYYSLKCPPPFKNRDFVTQRCWLDFGVKNEKYIINHSVNHVREPPKKNYVRGISYLTGYFIVPTGPSTCTFYYMTQSDPGGMLPVWAVNKASRVLVPKLMKKLSKACLKYEKWKSKNSPQFKPWLYPEQITVPRYTPSDVIEFDKTPTIVAGNDDESSIKENCVDMQDYEKDE